MHEVRCRQERPAAAPRTGGGHLRKSWSRVHLGECPWEVDFDVKSCAEVLTHVGLTIGGSHTGEALSLCPEGGESKVSSEQKNRVTCGACRDDFGAQIVAA